MKNYINQLLALITSILLLSNETTAQFKPPGTLIKNQLTPEYVKVQYDYTVSKGSFEDVNKFEREKFSHQVLNISGFPIDLIGKDDHQLYLGLGYQQDQFSKLSVGLGDSIQTLHTINLGTYLSTRLTDKFYLTSYVQASLNGTKPFTETSKTAQMLTLTKFNYRFSNQLNTALGMLYSTNLGDPLILPAITFVYSNDDVVINVDFPIKAEAEWLINYGEFRPVIGIAFPYQAGYNNTINDRVGILGTRAYIGLRYRLVEFIYPYVELSTALNEKYDIGSTSKEFGNLKNDFRISFGLNMQVSRFIPY